VLRAVRTASGIEAMAFGSGKRRVAVPLDPLSAIHVASKSDSAGHVRRESWTPIVTRKHPILCFGY